MSDRERIHRPDPARTHPIRHASGAFRSGEAAATPSAGSAGAAPAGTGRGGPGDPFAWPDEDPVSRAVRAGCDVVEKAVRRGFGLGRDPSSGPPWAGPWTGGAPAGPWTRSWTTGQWIDAMTSAVAQWTQWIDAWSAMVRSAIAGAEPAPGVWPPWPSPSPSPSPSLSPSLSSTGAAGALRVTIELRCARAASVELDLAPALPSGPAPGAPAALEVHGLVAPAAAAAPPITDVTVAIAGGGVTVALGSVEHHPAGTYAGAVLSGGRACGTLTVRLT